jgi:drug/metabolite transporter (DMT)-like permease
VLIGPSAGYNLQPAFFERFERVSVLEPDPIARLLFRRRLHHDERSGHPRLEFIAGDHLVHHPERLVPLLEGLGPSALLFSNVLGQLVTLLACGVWSLGTIYMRNHSIDVDLFALVGLQMLLGGVWMSLAGFALGEAARWQWSMQGALSLAYLVIFSCCFAYTAYAWLARNATPAQVGTYSYVNPAVAAVVGYLALGETLSPMQMVGGLVILCGVLMINWPVRSPAT